MKNNGINDKELTRLFELDADGITPDAAVRDRLEYTFMVKSRTYKTAQNSFAGMFSWLFSWSHIPLKAALVSMIVIFSFMNIQPKSGEFLSPGCDTTLNSIPYDSMGIMPLYADSCFNVKS